MLVKEKSDEQELSVEYQSQILISFGNAMVSNSKYRRLSENESPLWRN